MTQDNLVREKASPPYPSKTRKPLWSTKSSEISLQPLVTADPVDEQKPEYSHHYKVNGLYYF